MRAFTVSINHRYPSSSSSSACACATYPCLLLRQPSIPLTNPSPFLSKFITPQTCVKYRPSPHCSSSDSALLDGNDDYDGGGHFIAGENGVFVQIKKLGTNSRRIRAKITINATLDTIWNVLTDYEKLADFIPGLAVSKLIEKKDNFVRLYQIGRQNLPLGLKFNAKAILDCYEKDIETLESVKKRDIEFKMTEGDFQLFEGKWSIEQVIKSRSDAGQEFETTLSYFVDVKPKLWLPVHLVEGRLCKEVQTNLSCIRDKAEKMAYDEVPPQW